MGALEVGGAQGGADEGEEGAEDAVGVEVGDGGEAFGEGGVDAGDGGFPVVADARVEAGFEEVHEVRGDRGVGAEGGGDERLGEHEAALAEVLGEGAEDDHLAPGEAGGDDEFVEPVGFGFAGPGGAEGVLEADAELRH
ncbi:hypothetical protein ADL26_20650 [Thermoactinomyces vulgaris]|nr:hypothetical protein ADL26_20650 [Thermoactinomyces vulgaris]